MGAWIHVAPGADPSGRIVQTPGVSRASARRLGQRLREAALGGRSSKRLALVAGDADALEKVADTP